MSRLTPVGALRFADPAAWKEKVKKAMKEAGGRVPAAAVILGVSSRQLFRWLALDELANIPKAEYGLPLEGRRGRKKKEPAPVVKKIPTRRERREAAR